MKQLSRTLVRFLASRRFFCILLIFFVCEALWIVFSAMYPMAFDEDFHLGVIRIYANQWSPILSHQPNGPAPYGALTIDPSYLYHYLMSFPYRAIAAFTDNQAIQVVCMRLINVAFFSGGIVLFRRVLLRAKTSPALTHTVLALFVLVPIVPQLAAHINYDNLLVLLVPLLCLLAMGTVDALKVRRVNVGYVLLFTVLALVTSLVKYAALPIVLGMFIYLVIKLHQAFRGHCAKLWTAVASGWQQLTRTSKVAAIGGLFIMLALFAQRYGLNLYRYHTLVPDCNAAVSVERCNAYGPFARNYRMHNENSYDFNRSLLGYTGTWLSGMWERLFFTVNGPVSSFATRLPLPTPSGAFIVISLLCFVLLLYYWRRVFKEHSFLVMFTGVTLIYCVVLWIDGYMQFLYTRQPVAINGRYLIPLLPLMGAVGGRALSVAFRSYASARAWLAALAIILFLYGGGAMTFILRSDHSWDWQNPIVFWANDTTRAILSPIIVEGKPY